MICKQNRFMKGIKKTGVWVLLVSFSCLVYFIACYSSPEVKDVTQESAKPEDTRTAKLNERDAKILEGTYTDGMLEMRLADTVKEYAVFDGTKKLAMQVSDLHSDLNAQLANVAAKRSVHLPGDIAPAQLQVLNKMSKIKGTALDKAYIDITMAKNKRIIDLYKEYIASCNDSELAVCFKMAVPQFQKHFDKTLAMVNKK